MTSEPLLTPPSRGLRVSLRVMQLGAIGVVLAVSTYFAFELDRFFIPKELVLHLTAVLAALFAWRALRVIAMTRADRALVAFVAVSALSALLATNHWLALRALAISASGVLLFWAARALRDAGLGPRLAGVLAFAVVLIAILSLVQAYGVGSMFFSENRAPGGTLGNRNFVAHAAALGLPVVLLSALRGRRIASFGVAIVVASLVLTRSRAAWLAFIAVMVVSMLGILLSSSLRRSAATWRRLAFMLLLSGGAVGAALLIPNALRWRSDNPYLETARRVADYRGGSGHGRLIQYTQSLFMAAHHPFLGVGPGNWAVVYPKHAVRDDPSMSDSEGGATSNPWPSSDWIAFLAERGPVATGLLLFALATIAFGAIRQLRAAHDAFEGLQSVALLGTLAGAGVAGAFDGVLLLALPSLLVWSALGVLWTPLPSARPLHRGVMLALMLVCALGVARSSAQLTAMSLYTSASDRATLDHAARIDPGNYRLQLRLARMGNRAHRCEHARAAHALYPSASAAIELSRRCGK